MNLPSRYCIRCEKRVTNKQRPKMDCENCIACFKKRIEFMELNDFIDRMNEKHETAIPNFELTKNRITRPKGGVDNIHEIKNVQELNQFIIRMNQKYNTNVPTF